MTNIHQQIEFMERLIRSMKEQAPKAIEAGRLTEERAIYKQAVASDVLQTLTQLRGIVRGEDIKP